MNSKQIIKKLSKAAAIEKSRLLEQNLKFHASKVNYRNVSGLTYKVGINYFSNARGTCGFNPEIMSGHSYGWYSLVKKIKGQVILNDYRYSQQTSIHIRRVKQVLKLLGIKYKTLSAPRGLQDLDAALVYELQQQAETIVRFKYSRSASKSDINYYLKQSEKNVKLLAELGKKATLKMRKKTLQDAEEARLKRNRRAREQAAEKRAMAKIEIVHDFENKMHDESGYHLIKTAFWNWNNGVCTSIGDYDKREALRGGFPKIIVHSEAPKLLKLVVS